MITVVEAASAADLQHARGLFNEYFSFLQREIDTTVTDLNEVPPLAGYHEEIANLPGRYAAPDGRLLIAYDEGVSAGCVALYKLDESVGEVKRLWVNPASRGKQVGRLLMEKLIAEARDIGYQTVLLSTVDKLKPAISLYTALGFQPTSAYFELPAFMRNQEIFLKLDLSS